MKRWNIFMLLSVIFSMQFVFAGPFGIDKGMDLAQVKAVCTTPPKHIRNHLYEITPIKTHDMFKTYYVRIDPVYGVYWLKAIGRDLYTNSYGETLKFAFESLVASIRKTYGEESYRIDELKEGSVLVDPDSFMYTLENGDRELSAVWSKFDVDIEITALYSLIKDATYKDCVMDYIAKKDTVAIKALIQEKISHYKELPDDISAIYVGAEAKSSTKGYVILEYGFSNEADVQAKEDSVF